MKQDWNEVVRRSIRMDFANANFKRYGNAPKTPHPVNTKRVLAINEQCEYYRFKKHFVGHLVRIVSKRDCGNVWVEFVNDEDRKALNNAAGWSDYKSQYLLYGPKFDD